MRILILSWLLISQVVSASDLSSKLDSAVICRWSSSRLTCLSAGESVIVSSEALVLDKNYTLNKLKTFLLLKKHGLRLISGAESNYDSEYLFERP